MGAGLLMNPVPTLRGLGMNLVMRGVSGVSPSVVVTMASMSSGAGVTTMGAKAGSSPATWTTVLPSMAMVSSWRAEIRAWTTSRMRERAATGERKV